MRRMPPAPPAEKLSWTTRLGFGLGDMLGGGAGVMLSLYYLAFLTDVVRLPPAWAGTVILLSKVYDSLTDPLEGFITDRTRTRWGRRRPYLLAGVPLIALGFMALYYPHNQANLETRFLAVLAGYIFFSTVSGLAALTYNALQAEITLDYHERSTLSATRLVFSMLGAILTAWLPLEIIRAFPDVRAGYLAMSAAVGVLLAVPLGVTASVARERPEFQHAPPVFDWRAVWLEPWRNRTFRYAVVMYVSAFVALDALVALVVYFATHILGRAAEVNGLNVCFLAAQALALPGYVWLSRRLGKARVYRLGVALCSLMLLAGLALNAQSPAVWVYGFAAGLGLGAGGIVVMMYAIFPDIPDVDELRSGQRREAAYAAWVALARKFSSALALFAVGWVIELAGYVPPAPVVMQGVTQLLPQPQPETFLWALRFMVSVMPLGLLAVAWWAAGRLPLTPAVHQQLQTALSQQRAGQPLDPASHSALVRLLLDKTHRPKGQADL